MVDPLLVRACRREPVERTPVWFMRQAGRSLPEYRALRERYGLFEIVAEPELCAEVTLQPVRRHDVDAAVMFTDIMFPVLPMGVDVELVENVGPVVENPVRSAADVDRLRVTDPEESVPTILEAVRLVRGALRDDQAVIGFCGAGAPGRRPCVLELDGRGLQRARLRRLLRKLEVEPAHDERSGSHGGLV